MTDLSRDDAAAGPPTPASVPRPDSADGSDSADGIAVGRPLKTADSPGSHAAPEAAGPPAPAQAVGAPSAVGTSARAAALARAVVEIEEHVAQTGWDAPVRVFALVRTSAALAADPNLAQLLDEAALAEALTDPQALTAVEQEGLPAAADVEDLLGQLAWPESVDGVALSVERLVLPAQAEAEAAAIDDPQERLTYVTEHPQRDDMRLVVGVLRSGQSWCALRSRRLDTSDAVVTGADLVPGLIDALSATLS